MYCLLMAASNMKPAKTKTNLREADIEHIVTTYSDFSTGKLQPGVVEDKSAMWPHPKK